MIMSQFIDNKSLLQLTNLTRTFSDFTALDHVNLSLAPGEIFGFLGPNGAGKTTTIKMIAGLLQPSSGTITICGRELAKEPIECKAVTGYIPDRPFLYEKLTGSEYLGFVASLYPVESSRYRKEMERYLELFDLIRWKDHLIEGYSHGMRQKLIMTSIFMLNQPLIIVDEPMVGLDPKSARIVKELVKAKAAEGTGIFLSTHSMEIAEELCDRVAIIVQGEVKTEGSIHELKTGVGQDNANLEEIFLELTGAHDLQEVVRALRGNHQYATRRATDTQQQEPEEHP